MPAGSRWPLALLSGFTALVFGWAGWVLPWRSWTVFSVLVFLVSFCHLGTTVLCLLGRPSRLVAWRLQSVASLFLLAYATWNVVSSATTIAVLYRGLGQGIAVGLAACWAILVLFTVPLSVWGFAVTRGLGGIRRVGTAVGLTALATGIGLWSAAAEGRSEPLLAESDRVVEATRSGVMSPVPSEIQPASLAPALVVQCERTPGPGIVTALLFRIVQGELDLESKGECIQQKSVREVVDRINRVLGDAAPGTPVKIDWVSARAELANLPPGVDGLGVRPGLDGVCRKDRCFAPWQLLAQDLFVEFHPLPSEPDFRFGIDLLALSRQLGGDDARDLSELWRIETVSLVRDSHGRWHEMERMRSAIPLTRETVERATQAAENHIVNAQGDDGRFRYRLDPVGGHVSYRGFSIARQAGTTLVLCELGRRRPEVNRSIERSLAMLASLERRHDDVAALFFPAEKEVSKVSLGSTALSLIAFARCRDRVGSDHDELMGRMARFLLAMQRPDGGFNPQFQLGEGGPVEGPEPMYAGGQSVFALVLMEWLAQREPREHWPSAQQLASAVDRAMTYYATEYWPAFAAQFLYVEENWHCLAARAALKHHRHSGYEQFCLDYVEFKRRLILDDESRVRTDFRGGYGLGNVLPPHNTATAGFGETQAAAMAVRRARGEDRRRDRETMAAVVQFLLHHQWTEANCFVCTTDVPVVGAWSESMGSLRIRIDYVQHAWAAVGHGAALLDTSFNGA